MSERVLTERELNRALLARQLLLERSGLSIPRAVERVAGIQAQYAPSMYIGLWSRLRGFDRAKLDRALERRSVVQGTSLRATIHLLTPSDWWAFAAATSAERRKRWLAYHRGGPDARRMSAIARRVEGRLGPGEIERAELQELIGLGPQGISGINVWLDLVRVPPSGTWARRRADLFADARSWIGPAPELDRADATVSLVRSYLTGFGPASAGEIADWASLPTSAVQAALGRLKLRRFLAEDGAELVDLPRLALPAADAPAPVRFLPVWDATLLAHARRAQVIRERDRPRVFSARTPQSAPTFLVDGQVEGKWRFDRGGVRLEPFRRLGRAVRGELEAEAERLTALHA